MKNMGVKPNYSDSELAANALAGQRDAFAQIVMRYQSLVCSLAYSATGSLSQSEDLAQETFIAAWKGLRALREPEKLRSWLCSIARNMIANAVRHKKQEPALTAESLDAVQDQASSDLLPVEHAISSEEESILCPAGCGLSRIRISCAAARRLVCGAEPLIMSASRRTSAAGSMSGWGKTSR